MAKPHNPTAREAIEFCRNLRAKRAEYRRRWYLRNKERALRLMREYRERKKAKLLAGAGV